MKIAVSFQRVGIGLHGRHDLLHKAFEQVQLRRRGWPSTSPLGLTNETAGRVLAMSCKDWRVLNVRGPDRGIGHDRGVVLERIADVAVLVRVGAIAP
jgi:hypothetical protein